MRSKLVCVLNDVEWGGCIRYYPFTRSRTHLWIYSWVLLIAHCSLLYNVCVCVSACREGVRHPDTDHLVIWLAGPWRYYFQMGHPTDLQSESHWNWNMVMQDMSRPSVWCWLTFSWLVLNLTLSHCLFSLWHKKAFIWIHCPAQKTEKCLWY